MKLRSLLRLVAIVVVMTWLAIELHELGHFSTYLLFGYRARTSLQRVTPVGDIPGWIDHLAKVAGPAISLLSATILLTVAHRRPTFGLITAAFTNATLRLFPCAMDLNRAIRGVAPFSDEGEVALAFTNSPFVRAVVILLVMTISLTLTILAARQYRFRSKVFLKSLAIYVISLAVGIGVVILDELLGWSK